MAAHLVCRKNGADTTTLGNGGAGGKHQDTAFLTVAKALTVAQAGDQIVISPKCLSENCLLTVPDNVSIKGSDQRTTIIENTASFRRRTSVGARR